MLFGSREEAAPAPWQNRLASWVLVPARSGALIKERLEVAAAWSSCYGRQWDSSGGSSSSSSSRAAIMASCGLDRCGLERLIRKARKAGHTRFQQRHPARPTLYPHDPLSLLSPHPPTPPDPAWPIKHMEGQGLGLEPLPFS